MKDYAKIDTSPKTNKYEIAYYCITFTIVFISIFGLLFV